ncbi:MAG: sce7726 family protein [Candidatus Wolfebacteria bacterium]|nr:sce7726 family protein [Candidatus Wolfebacteria bacterium]
MIEKQKSKNILSTNDLIIRSALKEVLKKKHAKDKELRIIDELGVQHGSVRIDIAVINGIMHGYEIKSDRDTLERLPEQVQAYNAIFDQVTLILGSKHLIDAFKMIPDWWGVETAHVSDDGVVFFNLIRKAKDNPAQHAVSIARLLWRQEALDKLESLGKAEGIRSKPREVVYQRLAGSIELKMLKKHVRSVLLSSRQNWRTDVQLA